MSDLTFDIFRHNYNLIYGESAVINLVRELDLHQRPPTYEIGELLPALSRHVRRFNPLRMGIERYAPAAVLTYFFNVLPVFGFLASKVYFHNLPSADDHDSDTETDAFSIRKPSHSSSSGVRRTA